MIFDKGLYIVPLTEGMAVGVEIRRNGEKVLALSISDAVKLGTELIMKAQRALDQRDKDFELRMQREDIERRLATNWNF